MGQSASGAALALLLLAGCGAKDAAPPRQPSAREALPPAQRDAETLGEEVLELVDRAVDYRGSHQGRPAATFRQIGIDSLTPTTVRRLVNLARAPVVTVAFRRTSDHELLSCRGDDQILEEATLNGGQFTVMCSTTTGAQRPIRVGAPGR